MEKEFSSVDYNGDFGGENRKIVQKSQKTGICNEDI